MPGPTLRAQPKPRPTLPSSWSPTQPPQKNPPPPRPPAPPLRCPPASTPPPCPPAVRPPSGKKTPALTWGARLRQRRLHVGLSLQGLADKAGCSRSYLSMLETGSRGGAVDHALLARLEAALAMEPGALRAHADWAIAPDTVKQEVQALRDQQRDAAQRLKLLLAGSARNGTSHADRPRPALDDAYRSGELHRLIARLEGDTGSDRGSAHQAPVPHALPVQVPLINSVAAGPLTEFTDLGYPAGAADEHVRAPDPGDPDAFAVRIHGDSMSPQYLDGDIVVCSPARPVRSGADCFVRLERDDESTFKRVVLEGAAHAADPDAPPTHVRLVPLNPAYPERTLPREAIAFMCPAVSVTRTLP